MRTISWTILLCQSMLLAVHLGADCTESPTGRRPGNHGKPHAECDAKRRTGSPPGPDVHQLQRSQHKKSRQQRPGAPAHVCLLPGAGRGRCLLESADVRKSGECHRCATYRQPLRATLADRGTTRRGKVVVHVWNRCECRPGITLSAWWLSRRL